MDRIVLHIPHSSPVFPMGYGQWSHGIEKHIVRWTDWFTDWIFCLAAGHDPRIIPVTFPFSRFFCDVERLENDPLASIGQGIIYTDFEDCHRRIGEREADEYCRAFYHLFMDRLRSSLSPSSFLIDCHSFPSDLSDVDVCIGFNDDWSRPEEELLKKTEAIFQGMGFRTGLNQPYSNSLSPSMPFAYRSMMIELNKRTYLNGPGELDRKRMQSVVSSLRRVFSCILGPEL